jgi:hypothetical protein
MNEKFVTYLTHAIKYSKPNLHNIREPKGNSITVKQGSDGSDQVQFIVFVVGFVIASLLVGFCCCDWAQRWARDTTNELSGVC